MRNRRRLPRIGLVALAICALAVGGGALAWACTPSAVISATQAGTAPGSSVTVSGRGFAAETVTLNLDGQAVATATGPEFTTSFTIPQGMSNGMHYVVASAPALSTREDQVAAAVRVGPVPGSTPTPGTNPGNGGSVDSPTVSGGSNSTATAPGSSSGRASGGDASGSGRTSGTASGGRGTMSANGNAGGLPTGLATTASGAPVFSDSLASGAEAAERGSSAKGSPSARSASGDLWSGFASSKDGGRAGLGADTAPANGPGSALTLSLALAGLGLVAMLAGAGATAMRRRKAFASRNSD